MEKRVVTPRWLCAVGAVAALALIGAGCGSSSSSSSSSSSAASTPPATSSAAATPPATSSPSSTASSGTPTANVPVAGSYAQVVAGKLPIDITKYCGTKPFTMGSIDGFGGNAWRVETRELVTSLAKQCPDNKGVKYFDANLNPQAFNSTVTSWAAQGVNVMVAFDDFGQGVVPAFHTAQQQGMKVVTDNAVPGNATIPADVTAAVEPNFDIGATEWVKFLDKATNGKGKIVLVGGPPGNLFDTPALTDIQKAIAATGSKLTLAESSPQYANWDPAKTQQVMASLLNKDPGINGVVLTYNATAPAIIRAYQAAGKPLPAIAGQSSSNELVCLVHKTKGLQVLSLDNSAAQAAIALAKGIAAYEGVSAPELGPTSGPTISAYAKYIDTTTGLVPPCNASVPAGADLSTPLPQATIAGLLH